MKPIILQPGPQTWLSSSILSTYQDCYVARLRTDRCAHNVIHVYLASVAHFAHWHSEQRVDLSSLSKTMLDRFLSKFIRLAASVVSRFVGHAMNYGPPLATVTRKLVVLSMTAEHVTVPPTAIRFMTSTEGRVSLLRLLLRPAARVAG